MLFIQVPPWAVLLNGLCRFPFGLIRLPGQEGWKLCSEMGAAVNQFPCLHVVGEPAPSLARLFVILTQTSPWLKHLGQTGSPDLICYQLCLVYSGLSIARPHSFLGVLDSLFVPGALRDKCSSNWGYELFPLPGWRRGTFHTKHRSLWS